MSHSTSRRNFLGLAAAGSAFALAGCGGGLQGSNQGGGEGAPNFPTKPVELILPNTAGGSTDLIGRAIGKAWEKPLGQPVAIVNKPGANGMLGAKEAMSKKPDGYTLVQLFQSMLAITPIATKDASAVKVEDADVIYGLSQEDYMWVIHSSQAAKFPDLKTVLGTAGLKYGTAGVGTASQLAGVLMLKRSNAQYVDVPFEGGAKAVTALLGNQVDAITCQLAEGISHVKSGAFKPMCVYAEKRSEFLPDVPTAKELGFDVRVDQKRFIAAPKGLPANVKDKLVASIKEAQKDPAYEEFLKNNLFSRWEVDGATVTKTISDNVTETKKLVEENNIQLGG